ncbi:MAG TPA: hypothetical protein VJ907_09765 [Halanaerobiales bacterium]|nr:hypothetical protein [Halanaerobiales bacterium]
MKKTKLQINTVLKLKEELEEKIEHTEDSIQKYNYTELSVSNLIERLEKLRNQLIIVKETLQEANQMKSKDKKSNNYYVYHLSNLNRTKKFYNNLLNDIVFNKDGEPQLKKEEVEARQRAIDEEIKDVKATLSNFNRTKSVTIQIDETLDLNI